jgi:uncharacterized protein (DUF302 family)
MRHNLNHNSQKMLITFPTDKTVSQAAAALQEAVPAHHFGVMQVYNFKEIMAKKGLDFSGECLVFEICQPQQAKKLLDQNISLSTILPCRISVYKEDGQTIIALLRPTSLVAHFNDPEITEVAQEIEERLVAIMNEVLSA